MLRISHGRYGWTWTRHNGISWQRLGTIRFFDPRNCTRKRTAYVTNHKEQRPVWKHHFRSYVARPFNSSPEVLCTNKTEKLGSFYEEQQTQCNFIQHELFSMWAFCVIVVLIKLRKFYCKFVYELLTSSQGKPIDFNIIPDVNAKCTRLHLLAEYIFCKCEIWRLQDKLTSYRPEIIQKPNDNHEVEVEQQP